MMSAHIEGLFKMSNRYYLFILELFCFVTVIASNQPPRIDGLVDLPEFKGQRYMVKKIGETLELNCTAIGDVRWILPNNSLSAGFDPSEVERRVSLEGSGTGFLKLRLESLKESDTGEYLCTTTKFGLNTSVYVYARDEENGNDTFLSRGRMTLHVNREKSTVVLPCRTNRFITQNVDLYIDYKKQTTDFKFDPRIGFVVNQLLLDDDEATFVHCKYRGDTSEIIVVPEKDAKRTKEMPEIEILDEWPHVGKKLLMKCKFRTQDRDKYELKWDCSTCDEKRVTSNPLLMVEIGIMKLLSIESLQETDSGIYECILTNKQDGGVIRRSRKRLQVSPTIGQLEVVTASRSIDVTEGVGEGASIQLIHIAKAYPSLNVKTEWRKYSKTISLNDHVKNIEDGVDSVVHRSLTVDELNIPNANVNNSGIYEIMITVMDYVYTWNWTVLVRARVFRPSITIHDKFGNLIKTAAFMDSRIVVMCVVEDTKPRKLTLSYSMDGTEWEEADDIEELSGYTYEWAIRWRTRANPKMRLRCVDVESNQSREMTIPVSEVKDINGTYNAVKSDPTLNEGSDVFEMDDVELICILPPHQEFDVVWMRHGVRLRQPDRRLSKYSQQFITTLSNITVDQAGNYECIAVSADDNTSRSYTLHIDVNKAIAPYIIESADGQEHEAEYLNTTELVCPIDGLPEPIYRWFKNGIECKGGSRRILKFPRVIVEDVAVYMCLARNRAGTEEFNIQLALTKEPDYVFLAGQASAYRRTLLVVIVVAFVVVIALLIKKCRKRRLQSVRERTEQQADNGKTEADEALLNTRDGDEKLQQNPLLMKWCRQMKANTALQRLRLWPIEDRCCREDCDQENQSNS